MTDQTCSLFKILSVLLQYPDEGLMRDLGEVDEAIREVRSQPAKDACLEFLAYVEKSPLMALQEEYTRIFDLNPAASLNLTYHKFAESRERGQALVRFNQMYKETGYEATTTELPDYLPLVLEFLSLCPRERGAQILSEYNGELAHLSARLADQDSPYARLLEIIPSMCLEFQT
jgi:nitrate reductase molybdenum cofactor assembly chaperone NarJ/NarW